jgi:hypothetical protein
VRTDKGEIDLSQNRKISSLLSPQATGGDIAEGGFQYQANLMTARIPNWLAQDGFTEMIRESLGDVEATFFVPGVGFRREFVEYKNHRMTPSEFWREIEHFQKMDRESPNSYHRFVLACTGVSDDLGTMITALRRVRDSYTFYDGASQIQETSIDDFVEVVKALGQSKEMADFLFSKVWFEIDVTDAEDHPRELFREALLKSFPVFEELPAKVSGAAYSRLVELVKSRKNQPICRHELEEAIWNGIEEEDQPQPVIRIHTLHDNTCGNGPDGCLELDWMTVFGGLNRNYPPSDLWNQKVVGQLRSTKAWMLSTQRHRRIHLSGHRRLSASIAIGAVFSAVSGFVIGMETKDGIFCTNSFPTMDTPDYSWTRDFREGESMGEMAVGLGVMRNIANEVDPYLETTGFRGHRLYLLGSDAIVSAEHANRAVDQAKTMILDSMAQRKARKILLFIATPAPFALFLGHRLNAIGEIQCHERQEANVYVPTCFI